MRRATGSTHRKGAQPNETRLPTGSAGPAVQWWHTAYSTMVDCTRLTSPRGQAEQETTSCSRLIFILYILDWSNKDSYNTYYPPTRNERLREANTLALQDPPETQAHQIRSRAEETRVFADVRTPALICSTLLFQLFACLVYHMLVCRSAARNATK